MIVLNRIRIALILLILLASPLRAHELWIDPEEYQVEPGTEIRAHLRNGENFEGIDLSWFDNRQVLFDMVHDGDRRPLEGRAGDVPAVQMRAGDDGLLILAFQSVPSRISYETWDKFQSFAEHKAFGDVEPMHQARGLPAADFTETYSRFSKTLIGVGEAGGADQAFGLETEFVALSNPYAADFSGPFRVALFYQSSPRANAQIEVFDRAPDGTVTISYVQTDAEGQADVPVTPGHQYLLDAVVLREPSPERAEETGAVWETLWAALTFAVPQ